MCGGNHAAFGPLYLQFGLQVAVDLSRDGNLLG